MQKNKPEDGQEEADGEQVPETPQKAAVSETQSTTSTAQAKKKAVAKVPKKTIDVSECLDYSHLYRSFYDIFVGNQIGKESFDLNYAIRETRNIYASFVNLIETNALLMKHKYQFDADPLERIKGDYQALNHFSLVGKNLQEMERQMSNRDTELMMAA